MVRRLARGRDRADHPPHRRLSLFFSHAPNEPPHVHVDRGSSTLKAWLDPVELARNRGFRPREINAILRLVAEHRTTLLEAWHAYFG
jgi:hypothetical protein